jgi:hypothetical protein
MACPSSIDSLGFDDVADREDRLRQLLNHPHIWKQGSGSSGRPHALKTGFEPLDEFLGGGWPGSAVTELLLAAQGIGELRLLMPALRRLQVTGARGQGRHQLCWVNPPYIPYAPALTRHGIDLSGLLVVRPESDADALWAMEQSLRSHTCAAVLGWFEHIDRQSVRRLQVAAEAAACWGVLLRPARFVREDSAAPLRILMSVTAGGLQLEVIRNRYGAAGRLVLAC